MLAMVVRACQYQGELGSGRRRNTEDVLFRSENKMTDLGDFEN